MYIIADDTLKKSRVRESRINPWDMSQVQLSMPIFVQTRGGGGLPSPITVGLGNTPGLGNCDSPGPGLFKVSVRAHFRYNRYLRTLHAQVAMYGHLAL